MKYRITFNETVEDRDVLHGGVTFHKNKPVVVDSDEVEMSPWFVGNPSFDIEEVTEDETTETETGHDDAAKNSGAGSAGEDAGSGNEGDSERSNEEVVKPKRTRRKAAQK